MYAKLTSKDETDRSDGTVADGLEPPLLVLPPHAARSPAKAMAGNDLASFMRLPHTCVPRCLLPVPPPGRECADSEVLLRSPLSRRIVLRSRTRCQVVSFRELQH